MRLQLCPWRETKTMYMTLNPTSNGLITHQNRRCYTTQAATASRSPIGRLSKSRSGPRSGPHSLKTSLTTDDTVIDEPSTVCPRKRLLLIPAAAFRSNSLRSGSASAPKMSSHKLLVRAARPIFRSGDSGRRSGVRDLGLAGSAADAPPHSWPSVPY